MQNNELTFGPYLIFGFRGVKEKEKHLYLDVFHPTAHKLARLVQIPRYVKYLLRRTQRTLRQGVERCFLQETFLIYFKTLFTSFPTK